MFFQNACSFILQPFSIKHSIKQIKEASSRQTVPDLNDRKKTGFDLRHEGGSTASAGLKQEEGLQRTKPQGRRSTGGSADDVFKSVPVSCESVPQPAFSDDDSEVCSAFTITAPTLEF